jgi:hypothetical protein
MKFEMLIIFSDGLFCLNLILFDNDIKNDKIWEIPPEVRQ